MAGSYHHVVADDGQLLVNEQLQSMLECCSGDVYEAVEEMYGMIWWLARELEGQHADPSAGEWVQRAEQGYQQGLALSPGTQGRLR